MVRIPGQLCKSLAAQSLGLHGRLCGAGSAIVHLSPTVCFLSRDPSGSVYPSCIGALEGRAVQPCALRGAIVAIPRWISVSGESHFFFQAEDGIRDSEVTGVQTCALP